MKRYSNLFRLPDKLYTQGSPILIAAGALLKDNQTGNILAQIKFCSLSNKGIKAVKVRIRAFDVVGAEIQGISEYQYLDLSAPRNAEFGQKTAIPLPNPITRSFSVACTSVIFSDNSAWEAEENAVWEPLPKQQNLENLIRNLAQQYRRDTSIQSHLEPLEYSDLWICSCGAVNRRRESQCCCCRVNRNTIFSALNAESLTQNQSQFEAKEAERRTIQERETKKRQQKKKIAIISIVGIVVLLVILILSAITSSNNKKAEEIYNNFLGQSFSGSIEDDDGFSRAYSNGNLNQYMTYWKTTDKQTLKFNNDGTVYYTSLYDRTVLAYPKSISEPDGYHNEYDGTYGSFSVSVSLDGTVYVKIGYHTCEVSVDSNNVPQLIYDYDGMTLGKVE